MEYDYEKLATGRAAQRGRLFSNPRNYEKVHRVLLEHGGWLPPSEIAHLSDRIGVGKSKPLTSYGVGLLMKKLITAGWVEKSGDSHATYRAVKQ